MQIAPNSADEASLSLIGFEAARLLFSNDISQLVSHFVYAISLGRDPITAVKQDLAYCLSRLSARKLSSSTHSVRVFVKPFKPNTMPVSAAIECYIKTDNNSDILVELIVSAKESELHVTLEQLSVAT